MMMGEKVKYTRWAKAPIALMANSTPSGPTNCRRGAAGVGGGRAGPPGASPGSTLQSKRANAIPGTIATQLRALYIESALAAAGD